MLLRTLRASSTSARLGLATTRPRARPAALLGARSLQTIPGAETKYHSPSTLTVPSEPPTPSRRPQYRWGKVRPTQTYLDAPRYVPGKGLRLAQLNIHSHHRVFAEQLCMDVLASAKQMGVKTSGIIRMPTRTEFLSLLRDHTGRHKGAQDQVRRPPGPRRAAAPSPAPLRARSATVPPRASAQFERPDHDRLIEFYGESTTGQDATNVVHFFRYYEHTILPNHPMNRCKITLISDEIAPTLEQTRDLGSIAAALGTSPVNNQAPPKLSQYSLFRGEIVRAGPKFDKPPAELASGEAAQAKADAAKAPRKKGARRATRTHVRFG